MKKIKVACFMSLGYINHEERYFWLKNLTRSDLCRSTIWAHAGNLTAKTFPNASQRFISFEPAEYFALSFVLLLAGCGFWIFIGTQVLMLVTTSQFSGIQKW
jgi:hypothetical protein